ncbi:ornithine cyclodeaminase family protein [Actinoplanes derwentensis]|uniref:Ornithine cyclodeaminase n=1 Tax=Actinoplanes derwentensis TaxID=113562 RepID=A0A1H2AES0_9ACTN|nr:ornithine cyclodeaminase family protein [Actinoplanes derwentensis]GID88241.1 ornithine cyclodeaminase [Actinoplanes derwentensis]SDT44481.1 ornithine cyclodeaminase [Actinoplanes derwentensis]
MLVISAADVHDLLTPAVCRDLMRAALTAVADGQVFLPLRTVIRPPELGGLLGLMTAHLAGPEPAFGLKSVGVFPGNTLLGKDAHQGVVTLFDHETGEPLAIVNASAVTEIRTAAVSALATEALARPGSRVLTIFGTGVQARAHLNALTGPDSGLRLGSRSGSDSGSRSGFDEVRVVGRTFDAAFRFDERARPFNDPAVAVAGADVIVTATTAPDPILMARWVEPGTHVNAVGSSIPTAAELDPELLARAVLVADRRESLLTESGDYLRAAPLIGPDHVHGELGDILTGRLPGRTSPEQITVFKSLGLAIEDVIVARYLYEQALSTGRGQRVTF